MVDDNYYEERFKSISIEQKRRDLAVNPMVNHENLHKATDEEIHQLYYVVYSSFDRAMQEILGESIFDDEW